MQINEVLDKITERNGPIVGCIARRDGRIYHNLEAFDMDCEKIADTIGDLLTVSDLLEEDTPVNTVFAEYDGNCLIGQRVDDSLLVAVSDHVQRAGFKKLQVGLSLQSRLLTKALDEVPEPEAVSTNSSEVAKAAETPEPEAQTGWSKLLNAVIAKAPEGPAETEPKDTAGKKRRVYRGQVYYE